jgi:hypothetical protein
MPGKGELVKPMADWWCACRRIMAEQGNTQSIKWLCILLILLLLFVLCNCFKLTHQDELGGSILSPSPFLPTLNGMFVLNIPGRSANSEAMKDQ